VSAFRTRSFFVLTGLLHTLTHALIKPIANPRAPVPVIGSAKLLDDDVVVDMRGSCPTTFTAFCDAV
jgi:hypothetical protein